MELAPELEERVYYGVKKRWKYVQMLVQHFKHWMKELVKTLNQRHSWKAIKQNILTNVVEVIIKIHYEAGCYWVVWRK